MSPPDTNSSRIRPEVALRHSQYSHALMAELAESVVHIPHHQQGEKPCSRLHKAGEELCVPRAATSQPQSEEKLFLQAGLGASLPLAPPPLAPGVPHDERLGEEIQPILWIAEFWQSLDGERGFPGGSAGKESARNAVDLGSIPGLGRSPGEGKGYPLQYSGLENSMDYPWGHKESDVTE